MSDGRSSILQSVNVVKKKDTGRETTERLTYHTMAPNRCNYCLKPIATEAGIKWHIAQSPTCHDQWTKLLERIMLEFARWVQLGDHNGWMGVNQVQGFDQVTTMDGWV